MGGNDPDGHSGEQVIEDACKRLTRQADNTKWPIRCKYHEREFECRWAFPSVDIAIYLDLKLNWAYSSSITHFQMNYNKSSKKVEKDLNLETTSMYFQVSSMIVNFPFSAPTCRKKKAKEFVRENGCRSRKMVSTELQRIHHCKRLPSH